VSRPLQVSVGVQGLPLLATSSGSLRGGSLQAHTLLLDAALWAVDTATEAQILAALLAQRHGRTVIIASHRLSTLQDADQILVLRHGRVTERGNHRELVAQGGWYATQWRVQQLEASLNAE
jgi:ATP-binding cassette subfamily B protein/ATP-binding cassette subfamily C protein/ATP-binding cassette subfamily B multidrug efflux pump